jgi:hypothetical protein
MWYFPLSDMTEFSSSFGHRVQPIILSFFNASQGCNWIEFDDCTSSFGYNPLTNLATSFFPKCSESNVEKYKFVKTWSCFTFSFFPTGELEAKEVKLNIHDHVCPPHAEGVMRRLWFCFCLGVRWGCRLCLHNINGYLSLLYKSWFLLVSEVC